MTPPPPLVTAKLIVMWLHMDGLLLRDTLLCLAYNNGVEVGGK